ncbi:hypothetical protein BC939DRAFT_501660 [Gamsiella multidivaricata]|uniref:uncharacterized protein n=1 Tax=Gamsiella multidivaricata TaxID=101098 RepID=UPI00221F0D0C|nr:uncharacterized protein BC939DRAFT_501660 [Gamsiella multidivaricata]KAI7827020.1 hypothetical protein BC939DRAFT_501660 [Gamsiella multidivaricata]
MLALDFIKVNKVIESQDISYVASNDIAAGFIICKSAPTGHSVQMIGFSFGHLDDLVQIAPVLKGSNMLIFCIMLFTSLTLVFLRVATVVLVMLWLFLIVKVQENLKEYVFYGMDLGIYTIIKTPSRNARRERGARISSSHRLLTNIASFLVVGYPTPTTLMVTAQCDTPYTQTAWSPKARLKSTAGFKWFLLLTNDLALERPRWRT